VPGAGWITFDPTNRSVGGFNLIPVAVARDIRQVMPVAGSFAGTTDAFQGCRWGSSSRHRRMNAPAAPLHPIARGHAGPSLAAKTKCQMDALAALGDIAPASQRYRPLGFPIIYSRSCGLCLLKLIRL
jgi:hypothetical protein